MRSKYGFWFMRVIVIGEADPVTWESGTNVPSEGIVHTFSHSRTPSILAHLTVEVYQSE